MNTDKNICGGRWLWENAIGLDPYEAEEYKAAERRLAEYNRKYYGIRSGNHTRNTKGGGR